MEASAAIAKVCDALHRFHVSARRWHSASVAIARNPTDVNSLTHAIWSENKGIMIREAIGIRDAVTGDGVDEVIRRATGTQPGQWTSGLGAIVAGLAERADLAPDTQVEVERREEMLQDLERYVETVAGLEVGRLSHAELHQEGSTSSPNGKTTRTKGTVNQRMLETIQTKLESTGWNSRQWATYLKCSKSTVVATETWKHLESTRLAVKAERMKDRRRS